MPATNLVRPIHRTIVASICVLLLGGCTAWMEQPASTPNPTRAIRGPVRVTRTDWVSVMLADAEVRADSIIGSDKEFPLNRVAIALSDVRRVEVQHVDVASTTWTVLLAGVAAFYIFLRLAVGGGGS